MGAFLIFVALAVAVIYILIYNSIIGRKNSVIRSWSDVVAYQRQKTKLLPDLERLTRDYFEFESKLLKDVSELRSAIARVIPDRIDVAALEEAERITQSVLTGFRAVAENYPELRAADVLRDLMAEMVDVEDNVAAAITIFNRNVAEFNSGIEMFPNSIVNSFSTKLTIYPAFRDSLGEADIEYQFRG
jgi:LemA protein